MFLRRTNVAHIKHNGKVYGKVGINSANLSSHNKLN